MAVPIAVEFELEGRKIPEILGLRRARVRGLAYAAVDIVLGTLFLWLGVLNGNKALITVGILSLMLGVFVGFATARLPAEFQKHGKRLAGATKVEFSEQGVHYIGARVTERMDWSQVVSLNDRPLAWVLLARPGGTFIIPKSVVPAAQTEAFVSQVMTWAGSKYKFRKR